LRCVPPILLVSTWRTSGSSESRLQPSCRPIFLWKPQKNQLQCALY
jgi:hypothetical protein